jgi:hypothetical protein
MSETHVEQMISELDIFSLPTIQSSVLGGDFQHFKPIQAIVNDGPITFLVPGSGNMYLDMNKTLLYVKMKISKAVGGNYIATDDYSVCNNLLNSLFSEVKLELNQTTVSSTNSMNHYRSYIENLFNYNDTAKKSHLTSALYIMDDSGKFDNLASDAHVERKKFVGVSKELELVGKLHCDVQNCGKYLLNQIDMRLTLTRNPTSLVIIAGAGINPKLEILDATLLIRKVDISPSIMLAHAKILNTTPAKYPYKRVEMSNFTISAGLYQKCIENMFLNRVPSRIIFGFCKNSAFSGTLSENCFNFEHFNVSQLALSVNGKIVGSTPYKLDFPNENYILPYIFSFLNSGNNLVDDGYSVGRSGYKDGFCLYAYDLTPDLSANEAYASPQTMGTVRLEINFAAPLPCVVNLIVHSETPDVMLIDRNREIMLQYKK